MQIKLSLLFFAIISCYGCSHSQSITTTVVSRVPHIEKPDRPQQQPMAQDELAQYEALPQDLRTKLESNDKAVKIWADQLSFSIDIYNEYAEKHNAMSDVWIQTTLGNPPVEIAPTTTTKGPCKR